jgi:lysine/arginine/ornithine transport system substrate-binding protein
MPRHLSTATAALLFLLAVTKDARAEDLPAIQKRGTLRVVVWTQNLPELFAVGTGASTGFEQEMLQAFTALHKLKLQVVPVPTLESRLPALLKGQGDLVAGGLVDTESRRKQVDFTSELFPIRHVVLTRKPAAPITTLEALRRARVGTIRGSSWADEVAAAGVPPANVDDHYTSADEVTAALRAGTVDAVVMSAVWAIVDMRKDAALQLGLMVGAPTSVAFAVRKDEPLLRAALDEYIGNMRRTPTWSRLVIKYFGEGGLEILRKSR